MFMADKETTDKASGMKHYAGLAVFSSAVGHALDGLDLMILGFALSGIMDSFGIDKTTASTLTTITLAGAFLGGLVFGRLADKYGRIRVLTYSVVFFGAFTLFSAFAPNFAFMAVCRFLAGVGIGAEFGIGMAIAAEASSPKNRAKATSGVGLGFHVGVLLASLLSAPIISAWGWRGLFAIGIVPAVVAIVIRVFVPEPPLYLKHRETAKEHGSIKQLFSTPERVRFSIAIIVLCTVQNCGYFGIMTWLPSYLNKELNLSLTSTGIWTAVTVLGMMLGISVFGFLADHLGRRPAFWIFQIGAAVMVIVYSQLRDPNALLVGGFFMGMFANGMIGGYGALISELFPTELRATAQTALYNTGRFIGGGLGPVAIAAIATGHGFAFALGTVSCIYVVAFVTMFFVPDRKGAALE
ncbi:MFS transporter [Bifidobacterium avesanii]|uniref:MFS transporter n=1 Tax=Bifidobacterium avesanii TaxID=1798157 RepID=A0A7K3TEF8_9BIFI|nr:MFS transporter [Bifidobacterium avesanii]KAB8295479.1 MFS transporter [Bifidobacterium avesanii]NEG77485.1 MFS transporter [Bifidobacterium avesanii]